MPDESQRWYEENILRVRETAKSKCCNAPIVSPRQPQWGQLADALREGLKRKSG